MEADVPGVIVIVKAYLFFNWKKKNIQSCLIPMETENSQQEVQWTLVL